LENPEQGKQRNFSGDYLKEVFKFVSKNINYKLNLLKRTLRDRGFIFSVKRVVLFLFRPLARLIKRSEFSVNFFYGIFPGFVGKIFPFTFSSGLVRFPASELANKVRYFWYSNIPGEFDLAGEKISRKDIFNYGGPNPKFICKICQKSEWLSRVRQKNLFIPHSCDQAKECEFLCSKQGDELWTNLHQNFDFSIGCDKNIPAPKCLCIMPQDKNSSVRTHYQRFLNPGCDQMMLVLRRRLAVFCQVDLVYYPKNINWDDYDFVFTQNISSNQKFSRPQIPVILYGHDFWPLEDKGYQWMIDWSKPDVLLTPYPTQWKDNYKISSDTKIIFYPFFDSLFFARPNLSDKNFDLLTIGATASDVYGQRAELDKQITDLRNKYNIEFSHSAGMFSAAWQGPVEYKDKFSGKTARYLNKWSEYLGSAKYVIFGKMKFSALVGKYYEVLGSGAVPIFPEVPDLKLLGIRPFEQYIPLSEIEGDNGKLEHFLSHYDDYKQIAAGAVKWYKETSDKMIFNDFENLISKITGNKYQKRLI
jgi:hypothetical protein